MEIVAEGVEVAGPHGPLLNPTSLRAESGRVLLVTGNADSERTALALVLSGRMHPRRGAVRLDGVSESAALRSAVAVVDAPQITEPEASVPVHHAVAEGLSLAGHHSGRRAVRAWLSEHGLGRHAATRFENLPPPARTSLLVKLARQGRGTRALVLDSPDRHGGDPLDWYLPAQQESRRGYAVVVLCAPRSADTIAVTPARIGRTDRDPVPDPAASTTDHTRTAVPSSAGRTEEAR